MHLLFIDFINDRIKWECNGLDSAPLDMFAPYIFQFFHLIIHQGKTLETEKRVVHKYTHTHTYHTYTHTHTDTHKNTHTPRF